MCKNNFLKFLFRQKICYNIENSSFLNSIKIDYISGIFFAFVAGTF